MKTNVFIPYQKEVEENLKHFKSQKTGLSEESAQKRISLYGSNSITEVRKINIFKKILKDLKSPMNLVLFGAFLISIFVKESIDAYVILSVILINTLISFVHDYKVEKTVEALKKISIPFSKVLRGGNFKMIKTDQIVPGDIVSIEEGDRIPADGRIIESKNLKSVESSLTGESLSVDKNHYAIHTNLPLADRKNMLYAGTFISTGVGKFLVTATGNSTVLGKIAESLSKIKKDKSLFDQKSEKIAKKSVLVAIVFTIFIFIFSLTFHNLGFKDTFLFAMATLVSIIPESMIALFSIILAIGSWKMSKKKALIRDLTQSESIGSITTIITDKTGTLTQNIMTLEIITDSEGNNFGVSGKGFDSIGFFHQNGKIINPLENKSLVRILKIITLCNNAKINKNNEEYEIIGEPTEAALIVAANKAKLTQEVVLKEEFKIDEPPFDSNKKYREVLTETINGERFIYIVGAGEKVLEKCNHQILNNRNFKINKEKIKEEIDRLADAGLRTLSVAFKKVDKKVYKIDNSLVEDMTYIGTVGLKDPLREGVIESVRKAKEAGIRVIMATGDHKKTAEAIGKELGLNYKKSISEEEIQELSDSDFKNAVLSLDIFARVSPETKMRIVDVLQKEGEIVAMTGDGINDAPALKKANVGIAMGKTGTDVARESSQIILTDDNFSTIINAIEEGRLIFRNIQKTGTFLLSKNFGQGIMLVSMMLLKMPIPLIPTQILWLNLITDSLAGLSLTGEKAQEKIFKNKPKVFQEEIISKRTLPFAIIIIITITIGSILIFNKFLDQGVDKARTMTFLFVAFCQIFNVLNFRSLEKSIFKINPFSNLYLLFGLGSAILINIVLINTESLRNLFKLSDLTTKNFLVVISISLSVVVFGEIYKIIRNKIKGDII